MREKINSESAAVTARQAGMYDRSFVGQSRLLVILRGKVIDGLRCQATRDKLCVMASTHVSSSRNFRIII